MPNQPIHLYLCYEKVTNKKMPKTIAKKPLSHRVNQTDWQYVTYPVLAQSYLGNSLLKPSVINDFQVTPFPVITVLSPPSCDHSQQIPSFGG